MCGNIPEVLQSVKTCGTPSRKGNPERHSCIMQRNQTEADTCIFVETDSAVSTFKPQLGWYSWNESNARILVPTLLTAAFKALSSIAIVFFFFFVKTNNDFTPPRAVINPPLVKVTEENDTLNVKLTPPLPNKVNCMTFEVCYKRCDAQQVSYEIWSDVFL